MPMYLYRREDGTTFEYRQKFTDDPLTVDPMTIRDIGVWGTVVGGMSFAAARP